MGLFDPTWKKLVTRSPPWFAEGVSAWDGEVTRWLQEAGVPKNGYDLSKALLYGRIAECLQALTNAWSPPDATFLASQTSSAARFVPRQFRGALVNIMSGLWGNALLRAAFRDREIEIEPKDGRTAETAVLLRGAVDNTLVAAGCLWAATGGHIAVREALLTQHEGKQVLAIDYTLQPLLGSPEEQALFFEVCDGAPPTSDVAEYRRLMTLPIAAFA